ncbi:BatD family protein [Rhodopirellula baltica]|uniref:DUF7939 domain-containing protein n=1 Tax=Rhodopirellula baltica WH47 TaxID=991778 RepID=F2AK79_RHOBT|nr:BatD family protein [Rhodopirellula baltica]EGF29947.1 conserved hypothetical protein, secreted [Rhodopirellula baltica WH47]
MTLHSQHAFRAAPLHVLLITLAWALALEVAPAIAADEPPKPVTIEVPTPKAWVGQRLPFYVKVRAPGSFVGATSFSLPQIPRTVILQVGTPVVSSEDVGDDSWFVQTHEFALYSQTSGTVKIPAFEVRYANRDGFTGPATDHKQRTSDVTVEIQQPPDYDPNVFLVTADKINVQETWDPPPGEAKQGDVIHRTITQKADQVSGMVLAPPPTNVPDGIQVYVKSPQVTDKTERGEFLGERIDTVTYQFKGSGTLTLPAIRYVWWNPDDESSGSHTLPEATFDVAAAPQPQLATVEDPNWQPLAWTISTFSVLAFLVATQFNRIASWLRSLKLRLNPPDRVAARKLVRACHANDARAAETAWNQWLNTQPENVRLSTDLRSSVLDLHRRLYGQTSATTSSAWDGKALNEAFKQHVHLPPSDDVIADESLPPLNPIT